ncbi:MAG: hypothetical protein K9I69_06550 [Ignavibacteriales bacterium]|nr:hypothetical protein [Ignavibacteriales bacterium]MCF8307152.1 hypothetical protein [Ignavibacteriales bacterium]MCF8316810.1 hypothetical protein [Ignavibacteriales bacterium]MCF8438386.1 hypothetical protein [Ignavibacteriales bacterium]
MKTALKCIAAAAFILFSFAACEEDSPTCPSYQTTSFTFAKAGNKWIYRTTVDSHTGEDATMEITRNMGGNIFEIVSTFPGSEFGSVTQYWYIKDDKFGMNSDSAGTTIDIMFDKNTQEGRIYSAVVRNNPFLDPGDSIYFNMLSVCTNVSVPAGAFNCFRVRIWSNDPDKMPETDIYINKNSGIIKQYNEFMIMELESKNF